MSGKKAMYIDWNLQEIVLVLNNNKSVVNFCFIGGN